MAQEPPAPVAPAPGTPAGPGAPRTSRRQRLRNLTNEAVIGSGVAAPANGSHLVSYRPPRMFYAGARFHFD